MSDNEINIAIAEACGLANQWVLVKRGLYYRPQAHGYTDRISEAWVLPESEANKHVYPHGDEPVTKQRAPVLNYTTDLNAMHEAESTLTGRQWTDYSIRVERLSVHPIPEHINPSCVIDFWLLHATARQRAEAFLRTIGKWKP